MATAYLFITIALYGLNLWLVVKYILPHTRLKPAHKILWSVLLLLAPFIGLWIYTLAGRPGAKRFDEQRQTSS